MAGKIPREFIDELLSRIDILDIVQQRLPLKRQGKDYTACCPFHNEKTPSFSVSQHKQFYYCFGCGASGSAIGFVMAFDNVGFVEAVETLASQAGMEIPTHKPDRHYHERQRLYDIMLKASQYFAGQLRHSPESQQAIAYLKQRGLSGEISAAYKLGLATSEWDGLHRNLREQGVSDKDMLSAGLIVAKQSAGHYDRFRNRIIFPIRDSRGRYIAFGGRTLGDDKAKYLNSPETAIFHKSDAVYGLYEACKAKRNMDNIIVVEGYMDVLALAQYGINNTVATLGTATNEQHIKLLFRHCHNIVFCFDADNAGHQAAWRALKNSLSAMRDGRQIQFMFLPDGEDPDSYIRKHGVDSFTQQITTALPFSSYFFTKLGENVNLDTIDGRAVLANRAKPLLAQIPDGVFKQLMWQQLNEITGYKSKSLSTLSDSTQERRFTRNNRSIQLSPVRHAIRLVLEYPALAVGVDADNITKTELAGIPLLCEIIKTIQQQPNISCGGLLERWRDNENGKHLNKLASTPLQLPKDGIEKEFADTMKRLVTIGIENKIQSLLDKSARERLTPDESKELADLLGER